MHTFAGRMAMKKIMIADLGSRYITRMEHSVAPYRSTYGLPVRYLDSRGPRHHCSDGAAVGRLRHSSYPLHSTPHILVLHDR